jgi:outer membrane biosynthesis protein TonB
MFKMKRFIAILLSICVLVTFAAFAVGSSEDTDSTLPSEEILSENTGSTDEENQAIENPSISESTSTEITEEPSTEETTEPKTEKVTEPKTEKETEAKTEKPTESKKEQVTKPKEDKPTTDPDSSVTVYITKTGKRYHYENPCGKGTYYPSTLSNAKAQGLTPCEKCVLH